MLKFDEQKQLDSVNGALALRGRIEEIVDAICAEGYKNICWLGIGGTWASALQAEVHMKEKSAIELFSENAAEYVTTGNKRVGKGTIVILSSVTGSTIEMVEGVKKAQADGAKVFGFIDKAEAELAKMVYYAEMDEHLAQGLVDVEKAADAFGAAYAEKHCNDKLHYFVGAGNQYGSTYSYAMCYWEEQHWLRTKSIHSAEFFHGMLEVIDKDTPVTVFVGEDSQRRLSERVAAFLPKVCANYTIIDTKDYPIKGISEKYRGSISHLISHAVTQRIDAHIEKINCHPMEIRRYYRQFDY